jgi:Sulfotransferase family
MLTQLLDSHPDIAMTYELHNFLGLGKPLWRHLRLLRKRNRWRLPPIRLRGLHRTWLSRLAGIVFRVRYALGLARLRRNPIDLDGMRRVLHGLFPQAQVIGDKYPRYVFRLDQFAPEPDLLIVVIYRDARDVVRSAIERSKRQWRRTRFGERLGTPASAARSWVRAIQTMERHRERAHLIRYEDLVRQPKQVVRDLGQYLGVDPAGFRFGFIKQDRVGKHKQGLSEGDLAMVNKIAGETMRRLGYS